MTDPDAHNEKFQSILANRAVRLELAQIRAHAMLLDLPGEPANINWRYNSNRVARHATAALIHLEQSDRQSGEFDHVANQLGQVWEHLATIASGKDRLTCRLNAILSYELAGYQANAACIARTIDRRDVDPFDQLTPLLVLFTRRRFVKCLAECSRVLSAPPPVEEGHSGTIALVGIGSFVSGLTGICRFLLTGDQNHYDRSLEFFNTASTCFRSIGAIPDFNLSKLMLLTAPLIRSRSTWDRLLPLHPDSKTWQRYLRLLARGLGERVETNTGVSELWPSQISALNSGALSTNNTSLILMPTSAGKTRIAEISIVGELVTNSSAKCIYVAPFNALTREVESSLSGLFSDLGFMLTTTLGRFETDASEQEALSISDVIVSTPEKLNLLMRVRPDYMDQISLIVLDEGQLLENTSRGAQYELLLTRIRRRWPNIRFVSLSAVIPEESLKLLASWLGNETSSISKSIWRPATQRLAYFEWKDNSGFLNYLPDGELPPVREFVPRVIERREYPFVNPNTSKVNRPKFPDTKSKVQTAAELAFNFAADGSVLVYCPTRPNVESVASAMMRRIELMEASEMEIPHVFRERTSRASDICSSWLGADHWLSRLLRRGIAVHHAGIPTVVRQAVESDFRNRIFQVIVATSTLAQGVNLPIKTVIMHSASWRDAGGTNHVLTARDYWNIAGRAGRAGEETSATIIHLCQQPYDQDIFTRYANRRNSLEGLGSGLLDLLKSLILDRISDEELWQQLDSELLALLVEESIEEVSAEWVNEWFGSTYSARLLESSGVDNEPFISILKNRSLSIVEAIPEMRTRSAYANTGFSMTSCLAMSEYIASNSDRLGELLRSDLPVDGFELIGLIVEVSLQFSELTTGAEPPFDVIDFAKDWVTGVGIPELRNAYLPEGFAPSLVTSFIEDKLGYHLPWATSSFINLAMAELGISDSEASSLAVHLPAMIKYGVPNPYAVWAMSNGISYRDVAIALGRLFSQSSEVGPYSAFLRWSASWTIEELHDSLSISGSVLEDVFIALQRSHPSPLIREADQGLEPVYPLDGTVVVSKALGAQILDILNLNDIISFQRDYDSTANRNAINCFKQQQQIGMLDRNTSQLIALEMDCGTSFEGLLTRSDGEGLMVRFHLQIRPT